MAAIRLFGRAWTTDTRRPAPKGVESAQGTAHTGSARDNGGSSMVLTGKTQAAYLTNRGHQRSAMFFNSRGNSLGFIKCGSVYTRTRSDRTVETATVVSVASDAFGIPHIRYELFCEKPNCMMGFVEGTRVLALKTFTEMYRPRPAH